MSYIRITSMRKGGPRPLPNELVITIDRTHRVLGNHDFVLKDHRDKVARADIIVKYTHKVSLDFESMGPISQAISRLIELLEQGVALAFDCWCAPEQCHGEVIRAEIERRMGRCLLPPGEQPRLAAAAPKLTAVEQQASLF